MVFSSFSFISIFLPIVFLGYVIIPFIPLQNLLLLLASLIFYAYGEPVYVILMIVSALGNYLFGLIAKKSKFFVALAVIFNIGLLCVFKYTGFIVATCNSWFGMNLEDPGIVLPIGISFFTFQALSYVLDVARGDVESEKNPFNVLLYVSFFPQLIAGPIVRYKDISREIRERSKNPAEMANGFRRFMVGFVKKVWLANTLGSGADLFFGAGASQLNMKTAWLGAVLFMLQIYFDFSGYSDMAIGLGRMFGFHFRENFIRPYGATSIQEFWRRWHISLSTWFKEYVYIPLGGNRKGKGRTILNKLIVFFLTGLWHGAAWTFVVWGLFHGFFLLLEEVLPIRKLPRILGHIYTCIVVCVGFVVFKAETMAEAFKMLGAMFTGTTMTAAADSLMGQYLTPWNIMTMIVAVLACAPLPALSAKLKLEKSGFCSLIAYIAVLVLFVACQLILSASGYNPFLYFKF